MTQTLTNFLNGAKNKDFATSTGSQKHKLLQHIIIDQGLESGDLDTIEQIKKHPELLPFFVKSAQTEVPIAGNVNGRFTSRRIDRLLIKPTSKTIDFIDYKTDTNKTTFVTQYRSQLNEYAILLRSAYPDYQINGYVLWLQDWTLDKII